MTSGGGWPKDRIELSEMRGIEIQRGAVKFEAVPGGMGIDVRITSVDAHDNVFMSARFSLKREEIETLLGMIQRPSIEEELAKIRTLTVDTEHAAQVWSATLRVGRLVSESLAHAEK